MWHVWGRGKVNTGCCGESRGKEPLGRPRHRWEDNIKVDLQEIGREKLYWIDVAQNRNRWRALVNAVMNLRVQ
jgi:hypothetical protein